MKPLHFLGCTNLTLLPQRETRFQFSQYLGRWGVRGSLESMVSGWWKFFPKKSSRDVLGGGFKYFLFSPLPGEMIQFDLYFSTGLKPPTSVFFIVCTPEDWHRTWTWWDWEDDFPKFQRCILRFHVNLPVCVCFLLINLIILLMVQKSQTTTWDV